MKKPAILVGIFICCSIVAHAREEGEGKTKGKFKKRLALDDNETSRFALHALGGRMIMPGSYSLESYKRFQRSYNATNAARLSTPLGTLQPTGGWYWGGGLHFIFKNMYYGISVARYNMESSTSATLKNGDMRELRMVMKPINMDFLMLVGIGTRVKAGMSVGYEQQHTVLYSGFRYNGGRISYGTDQALNGIYRGRSDYGITWGARVDVAIVRQLRLTLRGDYVGALAGKQKDGATDYELNPWKDEMYNHSASGGIHADGFNHIYLPENVANANNDNVYFVGQGGAFARLYRGWRFTLGLEVDLWAPRTN